MICPSADKTACCYFMLSELNNNNHEKEKEKKVLLVRYVSSIDQFSLNSSIHLLSTVSILQQWRGLLVNLSWCDP